jgi:hypothetical protein
MSQLRALLFAKVPQSASQGSDSHYKLAASLIQPESKKGFLMQRSSTLILGPETDM